MQNQQTFKRSKISKLSNGLYLHASSILVNGSALLFLGHSSSGKSTISRILSKQYPIIADDKVWINLEKDKNLMICDGEDILFPRKLAKNSNDQQKKYPLLAILRIFKSNNSDIKPVSTMEICRYLMDAVFEIDIQRRQDDLDTIKKWFSMVVEISKKIPGWELTFKKDTSIINLIYEKFDEKSINRA